MVHLASNKGRLKVQRRFAKVSSSDQFISIGCLTDQNQTARPVPCGGVGLEAQPGVARQPWTLSLLDGISTGDWNQAVNDSAAPAASTQRCCYEAN
jgi:hypothetical protein